MLWRYIIAANDAPGVIDIRFGKFKRFIMGEHFASGIFALVAAAFLIIGSAKIGIVPTCVIVALLDSMLFGATLESNLFLLDSGDSFMDSIVLDKTGIRCVRVKAEDQFMPWESVFTIWVLTDRTRGDRVEVRDCSGKQMIWWQHNRAAAAYLRREHPELSITDCWGNPPDKRWKI